MSFNLEDLKENQLQEILVTVGTPGFKYLIEALEAQINTQLMKLKSPSEKDVEELNYWRGLHAIYTTIVEIPSLASKRALDLEQERESLYTQQNPNWAAALKEVQNYQFDLFPQSNQLPHPMPPQPPRGGWITNVMTKEDNRGYLSPLITLENV